MEKAIFAGGCFWCLEAVFDPLRGVSEVISGYTGGYTTDPDYTSVSTGTTGHAEAVCITYNPDIISYSTLLQIFLTVHDPTSINRQGNDIGPQYRSAIFYLNEAQKQAAIEVWRQVRHQYGNMVTELNQATIFYPAEDYHQQYYQNNTTAPYCALTITPKIQKALTLFAEYY